MKVVFGERGAIEYNENTLQMVSFYTTKAVGEGIEPIITIGYDDKLVPSFIHLARIRDYCIQILSEAGKKMGGKYVMNIPINELDIEILTKGVKLNANTN